MTRRMSGSTESGRIWLEDGAIHYHSQNYGSWKLPIAEIRVIGEYTNQNGPFLDDWFIAFVLAPNGWYEASMYAEGNDEFRASLANELGEDALVGRLYSSTDFASRIIWPRSLHGEPFLRFTTLPGSWWRELFGLEKVASELSSEVKSWVRRSSPPSTC
jgi:hypothetical protein